MRQTRRTPPSCTRGPAGRLPGLLTNAGASRARVGGRPRRRCTQSTPSAPPREVNNPSRSKALGNRCTVTLRPLDTGDPLAPLRRDPATAGIFSDFDGTLSPIVEDPELAEPVRSDEAPAELLQAADVIIDAAEGRGRTVAHSATAADPSSRMALSPVTITSACPPTATSGTRLPGSPASTATRSVGLAMSAASATFRRPRRRGPAALPGAACSRSCAYASRLSSTASGLPRLASTPHRRPLPPPRAGPALPALAPARR